MNRCPRCGNEINDGQHFCGKCGLDLFSTTDFIPVKKAKRYMVCPKCFARVESDKSYCPKCGMNVRQYVENKLYRKRKRVLIALGACLLTFAVMGVTVEAFIPAGRQNKAINAIKNKDYYDAEMIIRKNDGFGQSNKLLTIIEAGRMFELGKYEKAINALGVVGVSTHITYNPNGGVVNKLEETVTGNLESNIPIKEGYEFNKWSVSSYSINPNRNKVLLDLVARYETISYKIDYHLDFDVDNSRNPDTHIVKTSRIVLNDPIWEYHTFIKWVDENNNEITELPANKACDFNVYPVWEQSEEQKKQEKQARIDNNYLTPKLNETNDEVRYGMYPQVHVTDEYILKKLNRLIDTLPTNEDSNGWTSYKYYINGSNEYDFAWYIDLDTNNDGYLEYRGVYYNSYRPTFVHQNETSNIQSISGYESKTVHWFKYTPITWRVLSNNDSNYFLLSSLALDSMEFTSVTSTEYVKQTDYQGNTRYAKRNNYQFSNLRTFLNTDFYNIAFRSSDKSYINVTEVDNSKESSLSIIIEDNANTNDKIFVLSAKELSDEAYGFSSKEGDLKKCVHVSDYAKCVGCSTSSGQICSNWHTRSRDQYTNICVVSSSNNHLSFLGSCLITSYGVVPAMNITIDK